MDRGYRQVRRHVDALASQRPRATKSHALSGKPLGGSRFVHFILGQLGRRGAPVSTARQSSRLPWPPAGHRDGVRSGQAASSWAVRIGDWWSWRGHFSPKEKLPRRRGANHEVGEAKGEQQVDDDSGPHKCVAGAIERLEDGDDEPCD